MYFGGTGVGFGAKKISVFLRLYTSGSSTKLDSDGNSANNPTLLLKNRFTVICDPSLNLLSGIDGYLISLYKVGPHY